MALIGRIISRRLGPILGDSQDQQHQQQYQDPRQYGQQGPQYGPYNYNQPPMNSGYPHMPPPPPTQPVFVGRKAERHYRKAERTMQRAEHRAERDIRRAERDTRRAQRRGEIMPFAPVMGQPGPAPRPEFNAQGYPRPNNGYEMRDMGYQHQQYQQPQPQGTYIPQMESRDLARPGPSTRELEDVPPPAYEEVDKKQ